jgi:hypothetical protein
MRVRTLWFFCSGGVVLTALLLMCVIWSIDAKRPEASHVQKILPIAGNVEPRRSPVAKVHTDTIRQNSNVRRLDAGTGIVSASAQGTDFAYVDVPFPVSASIISGCNNEHLYVPSCTRVLARLATMMQEPRDLAWAPGMEQKIQDEILSEAGGIFGVRNVECRLTICALEVTSQLSPPYGVYITPPLEFINPNKLYSDVLGYSPTERDDSGAKITITLVVYRRIGAF